jgi:flagellar hook assembly protein FlgD
VGKRPTTLLPAQSVKPFTLVGLTWIGAVSIGTEFKVRVRESGVWSDYFKLEYGEYQGVGKDGRESIATRVGSDPLLTGIADGVEVVMLNTSGIAPYKMKVTMINSTVTKQDEVLADNVSKDVTFSKSSVTKSAVTQNAFFETKNFQSQQIGVVTAETLNQNQSFEGSVVSPQGALVLRPRIVSREEWGADETWRDPVPKMGTTLLAGIVHHTASTNSYTPEEAPAQMRNLYAYFTKSLNYADMGYNFLVDKYGTIYEGRSGCTYGDTTCDSATMPVQGAHTAGLNENTFGVSAIGNYDVLAPENPAAMVESISSLMAWKLAPYGLDPNANAYILSTDTSGSSKYSAGETAVTQVISGHRDVGKTVCPGRYLYPYLTDIRARVTALLVPEIRNLNVTPTLLNAAAITPVSVSAIIPAETTWSVEVKNADSETIVRAASGTQTSSGPMEYSWNVKDASGAVVPIGRYEITLNASVGGAVLPPASNVVAIASVPQAVSNVAFTRTSSTSTKVSWVSDLKISFPVRVNVYRTSDNSGATWSDWTSTVSSQFTSSWTQGNTYLVEIKSLNVIGESQVVQASHVVPASYAAPASNTVPKFVPAKPAAVSKINFKKLSKNRVTFSWASVSTEYAASGYYYRIAKNGGKWGKWTKTSNLKTAVTLSNAKKKSRYKIQVKARNKSGYSPTVTASYTIR